MAPSIWDFMKRSTSNTPPSAKLQKMAPGLVDTESRSSMSGSTFEVTSQASNAKDEDYSSFMSDVMVVGAGPAGLMLAYVQIITIKQTWD
jgi:phenol 2-monooxygenase